MWKTIKQLFSGSGVRRASSHAPVPALRGTHDKRHGAHRKRAAARIAAKERRNRKTTDVAAANQLDFSAVEIYSKDAQCEAAQHIAQHRFLTKEVPVLPLDNCTQIHDCQCRYKHFRDRRQDLRRDMDHGVAPRLWLDQERRESGGRRDGDRTDF